MRIPIILTVAGARGPDRYGVVVRLSDAATADRHAGWRRDRCRHCRNGPSAGALRALGLRLQRQPDLDRLLMA